ncbi:MAG: hypothetical protein HDT26_03400 [Subdoligranulum sp.]|nr:hypothetical protein [Subdoligranulum sp.]
MNSNINAVLQNIVSTAAMAASEARTAVRSAGKAVFEKYDKVKLSVELLRLTEEQENVFSDIGRMLFLMHTGVVTDTVMSDEGEKTPQQVIDALLVSAEQLQQEMDVITDRLAVEDDDERICPECGRICDGGDVFCAVCGTRLAEDPVREAEAGQPEQGAGEANAEQPEPAAGNAENAPEPEAAHADPEAGAAQDMAGENAGAAQNTPEA